MRKATVIIIQDEEDKILLLKRHPDHPLFPSQWGFPGGKVEISTEALPEFTEGDFIPDIVYLETPAACAYRELKEETGIKVRVLVQPPITLFDDHYQVSPFTSDHDHTDSEITVTFPNREHVEYGWFTEDNLPEGTSRMVLDCIATGIS